MIKNIFLPEQIRGYYLFPIRILGFDIGKTSVRATQLYCKGKTITVEKFYEQPLEISEQESQTNLIGQAIKTIVDQAGNIDSFMSALSSSYVIFKELKLPFIGRDTIAKIIAFEVEPLLPFALSDAVIDVIVTKEVPEEKSSEVLVAAVQNQYMAQHLSYFQAAGIEPEKITVDLFALYGIYQLIPAYAQAAGSTVLLEIDYEATRLGYIHNGQLRFIRTLPKGLMEQVRLIARQSNITGQEAIEHLLRYGFLPDHNPTLLATIKKNFNDFFKDITFTLQSFTTQARPPQAISRIILFGSSALIKGLPELITELSNIECQLFDIQGLLNTYPAINTKNQLNQAHLVDFATALPLSATADFNLRRQEFEPSGVRLFTQQFLAGAFLLLLLFAGLLGTTFWRVWQLRSEAHASEREAIEEIETKIPKAADQEDLEETIKAAQRTLDQEEKTWSSFSPESRSRMLEYLLELTNKIDKQSLGLDIEKISILADSIVLRGRVKGFDELRTLEAHLNESKLFKVQPVPDPDFTTSGMVIKFKKPGGTKTP